MRLILTFLTSAALCPAFAQSGAILAGFGYSAPPPLQTAPGQVVTLFVRGVAPAADGTLRSDQATGTPLPAALAGISVRITQGKSSPVQAAIFAVRQEDECGQTGAVDPACLLTSIRMQIPFEVSGDLTLSPAGQYLYSPAASISIDVDGRTGRGFPMQPLPDNAHLLTTCDATWDTRTSSVCDRPVYHSDGTIVSDQAPAKVGETLSLYYYGLGQTTPASGTGVPAPPGAVLTDPIAGFSKVSVRLDASFLNAPSFLNGSLAGDSPSSLPLPIISAGLVPGQIGLYQVNFRIEGTQASFHPCTEGVRSNSLLTVRTLQGVEGIGICVQR